MMSVYLITVYCCKKNGHRYLLLPPTEFCFANDKRKSIFEKKMIIYYYTGDVLYEIRNLKFYYNYITYKRGGFLTLFLLNKDGGPIRKNQTRVFYDVPL